MSYTTMTTLNVMLLALWPFVMVTVFAFAMFHVIQLRDRRFAELVRIAIRSTDRLTSTISSLRKTLDALTAVVRSGESSPEGER